MTVGELILDVRRLGFKVTSMHSMNAGSGWVIKMDSSRDAKAAVGKPVTVRGVTLNIAQYHSEDPTLAWLDDYGSGPPSLRRCSQPACPTSVSHRNNALAGPQAQRHATHFNRTETMLILAPKTTVQISIASISFARSSQSATQWQSNPSIE